MRTKEMRSPADRAASVRCRRSFNAAVWAGIIAASLGLTLHAQDFPTGGSGSSGVNIQTPSGGVMNITASEMNSIINWQTFDIGLGKKVNFKLPTNAARILNRVDGPGSMINGTLWSNGHVYLVNPAGITFGAHSLVDVGQFYAAAASMTDADFLNGFDRFTDVSADIVARGRIRGGEVYLVGKHVLNFGRVSLPDADGIVVMAAGDEVIFGKQNGRIFVRIDGTKLTGNESLAGTTANPSVDFSADPAILNVGDIDAIGSRVVMASGDMYSMAIRSQGRISAAGGEVNLAATNGGILHQGLIESDISTFAAEQIHLNLDVHSSQLIVLHDPTFLRRDVDLHAAKSIARSTVDSYQGTHRLVLRGDGRLEGAVGDIDALRGLHIMGDSELLAPVIRTTQEQLYDGKAQIGAPVNMFAQTVDFGSRVDSLSGNADSRLRVVGDVTFSQNVGQVLPLRSLRVDGPAALHGERIVTTKTQRYFGPLSLFNNTTLTGSLVDIDSTVNPGAGQPVSLLVQGNARFGDDAGGMTALSSLDVTGKTTIDDATIRTVGHQKYAGGMQFDGDATLLSTAGGEIAIHGSADGAAHVLILTSGQTSLLGPIGQKSALKSLTTDGQGNTVIGGSIAANTLTLTNDVKLLKAVVLTAKQAATLNAALNGDGHDLTINSPATFILADMTDVGVLTTDGTSAGQGTTTLAANISGDELRFNNAAALDSDVVLDARIVRFGKTVDGGYALLVLADDLLHFGSDVGAQEALSRLETHVNGLILFASESGSLVQVDGEILFNPNGRSDVPTVATIGSMGDLHILSLNGDIVMGQREKLTALGDLTMEAMNGSITLGDLNSLGDMTVLAPQIMLQTREAGKVLTADGELIDDLGLDFVAGGRIFFLISPTRIGDGDVQFGTGVADETTDSNRAIRDGGYRLRPSGIVTADNMILNGTLLDLTPFGLPSDNLREQLPDIALIGPDEFEDDQLSPFIPTALQREALAQLNIIVRDRNQSELMQALTGRELIDDVSAGRTPADTQTVVSAHRLRMHDAERVLNRYADLFLEETRDPDTGEIVIRDQRDYVRETMEQAWLGYLAVAGATLSVDDFLHYAEQDDADALRFLYGTDRMFHDMWLMGINDRELRLVQNQVIHTIMPRDMAALLTESRWLDRWAGR